MVQDVLARVYEFQDINPAELRALARRVRILCIPAQRWLVRGERDLGVHLYLVKGHVATINPTRQLRGKTFGQLHSFYPGCGEARAISACQVLLVSADEREFILAHAPVRAAIDQPVTGWLGTFLSSHMMAHLRPAEWQHVLSVFQVQTFAAGAHVVQWGQPGTQCYVIESGNAVVHRNGRTLAHLGPGDFFGEDALILNGGRTATVTAATEVVVHAIAQAEFRRYLLERFSGASPGACPRCCDQRWARSGERRGLDQFVPAPRADQSI